MAGKSTLATVNDILNRVAAEVGIAPVSDPWASQDPAYTQMKFLLQTAGEELMQAYPWELLVGSHKIVTAGGDTGSYPLPDDFGYLLNSTAWDQAQQIPLGGPLSAQDWTYLEGRNLAQNTLYASFRIADGNFNIYPNPPPIGLDLNFEYISTNWVTNGLVPETRQDTLMQGSDKPLYDKTLITRCLKVKYLESAGFDTTKAQDDFNQTFSFLTGFDKGAGVLNAGRRRGYPYLTNANVPDTGFGL